MTQLFVRQLHWDHHHVGPSVLLALFSENYYVLSAKKVVRNVTRECVVCRKVYARTLQQQMGRLPADRVNPSPPFHISGVDLAGPFLCHRGNPRKPTRIKTYACLFICLATRAIHIETLSDLSTSSFLASFRRFCARRGTPAVMYPGNGTNFVGASRELREVYETILSDDTIDLITKQSLNPVEWKFSPSGAPHFGGLWEAGVKAMKLLMRKIVGSHSLSYEELTTVLATAESVLNSRPLSSVDSLPVDGEVVLTSGHFLIGRPLLSPLCKIEVDPAISLRRRWKLVRRLSQDIWVRWRKSYLQSLQSRHKWEQTKPNLREGNIVLVKDSALSMPHWPMGRVERVFPGEDELVRVVELRCKNKTYRRPIHKVVLLVSQGGASDEQLSPPGGCSGPDLNNINFLTEK